MTLKTSRQGPWMQTFEGRQFWPLDPRPEDVYLEDIAASLSKQCRFAGHSLAFYSVAEHSVRVSLACEPDDTLWGLLHDASEAYLVDVPRPIKPHLTQYRSIETGVMRAICTRFGLSEAMPESVKRADGVLLATEARDLMAASPADWELEEEALPESIVPWTHEHARAQFVARFLEISGVKRSLDYALLASDSDLDSDGMSQLEIAKILGCTNQCVYQIEKRALRKLRASMECHGLTYESLATLLRSL